MITSIKVINYRGKELLLSLTDPWSNYGIAVTGVQGIGPQKATINTVEVSTKDGSFFNSARIEQRNIVLSLRYMDNYDVSDTRRMVVYEFFHVKRPVTLEFSSVSNVHRKPLTCRISGYVESNENDIFQRSTGAEISIICTDPMFYDTTESATRTIEFSNEDPAFEFVANNLAPSDLETAYLLGPLGNRYDEFEFSTINVNHRATLDYGGDGSVGVNIRIEASGYVKDPSVYCNDVEMKFLCELTAGDVITVCTIRGKKQVDYHSAGTVVNAINMLDDATKWIQLVPGINDLAYGAEVGASNLKINIDAETTYEGI